APSPGPPSDPARATCKGRGPYVGFVNCRLATLNRPALASLLALALVVAWIAEAITARAASPPTQPCACRVRDEFRACAAQPLWPGFEPTSTPLAVYDGERTWLFDYPAEMDGMAPDPRCPSARSQAGLHPDVRSNTTITWGGRTVATVLGTRLGRCDRDSVL